jgi:DNA polymerase III subunit alpha
MENLEFKSKDFVHLHLHSDYSLLQSTIQLKPLAKRLNELEMKACAITDLGNMYGTISFYNAMKSNGIRPILGYEAFLTFGDHKEKSASVKAGERPYYNLVLLARDLEGYYNLSYLASMAATEGFHHKPRIDVDLLSSRSKGIIALSSGYEGAIGHFIRQENEERAWENARLFEDIFGKGNFYIEIQDHGLNHERKYSKKLAEMARKNAFPIVATNEPYFLSEEDARAQEILLCIGDGRTISENAATTLGSSKYHLRSAEDMWRLFGDEIPEALTNTLEIAESCRVEIPIGDGNLQLPVFPIPEEYGNKTTDEYFEQVVREGFEERKATVWLPMGERLRYTFDDYEKRVQIEIDTIKKMGFPGYFLIVWEFIKYAREHGIPVGPGRGSAAGSLVAYCLNITDVDPLQYDLLFERFLNPERVSMPDIDVDFCVRGRGNVISHVTELYNQESVCQIITFGTMASRAAIKDVGRALNMPYAEVEKIGKMIPPPVRGRNVSISQAIEQVPELKAAMQADPRVKDLVDLALRVEGCSRHTSVHAAGVVISPKPLHELVPIARSVKDELTSQYPMGDLEKVGMLKMDFLGLTTLTIIADCLKSLKEKTGIEIDWPQVSLNDEKTMELFGEGRTEAIFQFESSGMQEICRKLKPKELEDLSALNALYRPGPLDGGMVDDFIARHRGEKQVRYLVPQMKSILENTYGILVYQEQIMQIAQQLAGYSLGEADLMRRAMGKKKREEMAFHEEKFVNGAVERNIPKAKAQEIFDLMNKFADYGFNRSHSMAYAYVAFQTGYLKAHFPAYFYAAVLSHEADDSAKVYKYSNELRSLGLKLLPPDINESGESFTPMEGAVRFGLSAIKGIGSTSIRSIVEARKSGPFTSLFDFTTRIDQGAVNRRALESLITAGAFDSIKPGDVTVNLWRAKLFAAIETALAQGNRAWNDKMRGQEGLFGVADAAISVVEDHLPSVPAWNQAEISRQEKAAVGFYLTVHPLDGYLSALSDLKILNIADYEDIKAGDYLTLAGIVSAVQVKYSKKGNRFCIFRLEDQSSGVKCLTWSEAYEKYSSYLKDDELLIVEGRVESADGQEITLIVNDVKLLGDAIPSKARRLSVTLPKETAKEGFFDEICTILNGSNGRCEVLLNFEIDEVAVKIEYQPNRVQGSRKVERDLMEMGCTVEWML